MVVHTVEEYTDMVLIYGWARQNAAAAARLYRACFPNRQHFPTANTIYRAVLRLRNNVGNIMPNHHDAEAPRQVRDPATDEAVLDAFEEDPESGLRLWRENLAWRIALSNKLWKKMVCTITHTQRFCEWLLARFEEDQDFLSNILFTDESTFPQDGFWNSKNFHYWANENPQLVIEQKSQTRFSVKLWAGVIGNKMVSISFSLFIAKFL